MGKLSIMNRTGHTTVTWDTETEDAVSEAERIFNEHKAKGYAPFIVDGDGNTSGPIAKFDQDAPEILMVPNIVGG